MYGHASFHSSLQHKRHALQQSATLSGNSFRRRSEYQPCTCVLMFLHSIKRNKKMTCCGVEMCVENTGKTKQVPNELTFLLWKHQFRLAVWNEHPFFAPKTGSQSTGGTTWLTAPHPTPPPHFLSLTSWQPVLATSTRALPFLACCLHRHLTADDQMGTWENIQQLLLYGTSSRKINKKTPCYKCLSPNTLGNLWETLCFYDLGAPAIRNLYLSIYLSKNN